MNNGLKDIAGRFAVEGEILGIEPLGSGLINDTYKVCISGSTPDYVLQRINNSIFKDVELLQRNIELVTDHIRKKLEQAGESGIKLLWGTANVFGNKRYMNGASTNPDFDVAARARVQIKNAIDATIELGGECYVFWGGREGYMTLLNTDMKREKEHMATMLTMARDYARSKGFKGTFLIEPKPMEPTKHQ